MNLGVDFGSTYTTLSRYDETAGEIRDILLYEGSPFVPSVVARKEESYVFGAEAKNKTGRKGYTSYKGFKMLLAETRREQLIRRGFGDQTPPDIAGRFLDFCIREALQRSGEDYIDHLVVGVPEVWNDSLSTLDGRNILKRICTKKDLVGSVQVVSEPACASAFFSYNFQKTTGHAYQGHILLIDYGGGTLDITLTKVTSTDQGKIEIQVEERTGAGENEEGEIGKAGIVYMESVMETAILESGIFSETVERDEKFYKSVNIFEEDLKTSWRTIQDIFNEYEVDNITELEQEEFSSVEYKGEEISISYGLMVRVYNKLIAPVLSEKLGVMIEYMDAHGINYQDKKEEGFKIALVGGFGNYYLVDHQVRSLFGFGSQDLRQSGIIRNATDREKAVSMGASLLASGIISIRNTAPYSIGIPGMVGDKPSLNYAIRYKQEIVYDKVYFPCGKEDGKPVPYFIGSTLKHFVINRGGDDRTAIIVPLKEQFVKELKDLVAYADDQYLTAILGFSMDSSGILSLHVRAYNLITGEADPKDNVIVLDSFNNIFGVSQVRYA